MPAVERLTQKDFATRLGISTRAVRDLHAHGVPRGEDGLYPWPEARHWYIEFKQKEPERRYGPTADLDLRREQARLTAAKSELAELELGQLRGELYHVRDVERLVRQPLEQVDTALRNAPARHASILAGEAGVPIPLAMRLLEDIIERIRTDLRQARGGADDASAA